MSSGKLLELNPQDELKFHFELRKSISCTLNLTNKTEEYVAFQVAISSRTKSFSIAFNSCTRTNLLQELVKTAKPTEFEVWPRMGIMLPGSSSDITLTMRAREEVPAEVHSKDMFRVKCCTVKDIVGTDMFNAETAAEVEEYNLNVLYVLPEGLQPLHVRIRQLMLDPQGASSQVSDIRAKMVAQEEIEATLHEVLEQFSHLKIHSSKQECTIRDLEDKVKDGEELFASLWRELEELRQKLSDEQKKADDLKRTVEALENIFGRTQYSQFSYLELQEATNDFENSVKIGEGGYGTVYKGFLRHTVVAIKKLNCQVMQGLPEFYQQVGTLTKVRHPNLINLMGVCSFPEPCLVYEFLPEGSLEDRLSCKDNTSPLSWQARIRIAAEICSALIFLHSYKPHGMVHGNLKPSNILLDANLVTKLSDFGIRHLLSQSSTTTEHHLTELIGTFPDIDPEFGYTSELTASSDIRTFGVIILQLLTNRPTMEVVTVVEDALSSGNLQSILDETAGEWPFLQAMRLACLGMECCTMNGRSTPRLETDVWMVLEPMVKASSLESSSFQLKQENDTNIPSYFLCPIVQEVMRDPHVAADGFTYEAVAIQEWFETGHDTSPMTNLQLAHHELLPNHALRSVIQEWLQQRHQRH